MEIADAVSLNGWNKIPNSKEPKLDYYFTDLLERAWISQLPYPSFHSNAIATFACATDNQNDQLDGSRSYTFEFDEPRTQEGGGWNLAVSRVGSDGASEVLDALLDVDAKKDFADGKKVKVKIGADVEEAVNILDVNGHGMMVLRLEVFLPLAECWNGCEVVRS